MLPAVSTIESVRLPNSSKWSAVSADIEWKGRHGVRMSAGTIESCDHVTSVTDCLNRCALSSVCDSINFRSTVCQLVTHVGHKPLIVSSADLLNDDLWQWWSPSYTVVR